MQITESSIAKNSIVAVVDDDPGSAELECMWVEEAGYRPELINGPIRSIPELIESTRRIRASAVICDHRLEHRYATFDGAHAVSELYQNRIPGVLVTQYYDMDVDSSIRRWRHNIPSLISRDEADDQIIMNGLEIAFQEIKGNISSERRPHRAIIRIESIMTESEQRVVDALIPQWNPNRAVRFPVSLIDPDLHRHIEEGIRFIANVNIGAHQADDLFFSDFSLAPEPDPEDGLG